MRPRQSARSWPPFSRLLLAPGQRRILFRRLSRKIRLLAPVGPSAWPRCTPIQSPDPSIHASVSTGRRIEDAQDPQDDAGEETEEVPEENEDEPEQSGEHAPLVRLTQAGNPKTE